MLNLPYKLRISQKAKHYHLEIDWHNGLVVVVPRRWNQPSVDRMIAAKKDWVEKHLKKIEKERRTENPDFLDGQKKLTETETRSLFLRQVNHWAGRIGVTYNRIALRRQKSKWGSCSWNGNLNFNVHLAYCPAGVREYVIIHELCHLLHHNHSKRFWSEVEKYCPDHKIPRTWLRENGRILTNFARLD